MVSKRQPRPQALVALGVLGPNLYAIAMRFPHPGFMATDFFHGLWIGSCLGLAILGLVSLRKRKPGCVA